MRLVVIGLGVQGRKRVMVAGDECIATVDPVVPDASVRRLEEIPLDCYDAAMVCTPDDAKEDLLQRLLLGGKHVLVEKPLGLGEMCSLRRLAGLVKERGVVCYTAYNHRFEPHFVRMHDLIRGGELGELYSIRIFYGNGTARLVRNSDWRDRGSGVLADLGSHLLDTMEFWLGERRELLQLVEASRFENRAFDFVSMYVPGRPSVHLEMTLLAWRNHFYADVFGARGSAHIRSLCKWGPSTFSVRRRKLPSGRPDEISTTLVQPDPTWALEYETFKAMCNGLEAGGLDSIEKDEWIAKCLDTLAAQAGTREMA